MVNSNPPTATHLKKRALIFLFFIGLISFFADFTHEGARSIYGPYLSLIGASAFLVSFTAGFGEFLAQSLRIVMGWIVDKTKQYWLIMLLGYGINLLVIPLLMFVDASIWQLAIVLILLERVGKGIRAPAKSALTSFTSSQLGAGKAFAIQELMDQFGAFLGPLFVFGVISVQQGPSLAAYQTAFGLLGIFALSTLIVIGLAKKQYPQPANLEMKAANQPGGLRSIFVWYLIAVCLIALGFIDYPLLAYHLDLSGGVPAMYIPLLYALAMGVDAIAAFVFGILFDRYGVRILTISVVISLFYAPLFFFVDGVIGTILGLIIWGVGMGAQESILKAVVSTIIAKEKRGLAYGIFYTVFGTAWFLGSLVVGALYAISIPLMVGFAILSEAIAIFFLILFERKQPTHHG